MGCYRSYKIKKKLYIFLKTIIFLEKLKNLVNQRLKKLTKKTSLSFGLSLVERLKEINCPESIILDILGKTKKILFIIKKTVLKSNQVGLIK